MMRARRLTLTVLGVLAGGLVFSSAPAPAVTVHVFSSSFGSATSTPPDPAPLSAPSGVAVSDSTGDVYVVDKGNNRVERFNSTSSYLGYFNGSGTFEVEGKVETGTPAPSGAFSEPEGIAVDNSGKTVLEDPSVGDVYVLDTGHDVIDKFSATGEFKGELKETEGASGGIAGVAVDPSGNVWLYANNSQAVEFNDKGEYISGSSFNTERSVSPGLAVDSLDHLYILTVFHEVYRITPPAPHGAVINRSEKASGVAADQSSGNVYVDQGTLVAEYGLFGEPLIEEFGSEQLTSGGGSGIAVNSANGTVYVADSVANVVDSFAVFVMPDVTTGAASNIQLQTGSVTLNGAVNPLEDEAKSKAQGIEFEYGLSTAYELGVVVASPAEATGNSRVPVTAEVSGLLLNTVYNYRLNATNATGLISHGRNATFTISVLPAVDDQLAEVTDVGRAGAVFQGGTVNPENSDTFYHFAYVPAGEYQPGASNPYAGGGATEEVNAGAGLVDETVGRVPVGDLLPGTTYHYALVAGNTAGSSIGEDHTFTTLPGTPPTVSTGGVSNVSQNAATLSGTVDTNSLQTEYGFEIGTEPGTYSPATGLGSLGGATTKGVSVTLGELQPGTTYYYRVTATNADGTVQGAPESFTTPGFPTLIAPPASPPLVAYTSPGFPANTANTQSPTIAVVSHKVKGKTATIKVSVPAAGKLVATGKGVSKGTGKASKAGDVTVKVSLTKKEQAFLAKHKGRKLKVAVKLSFTPTKGSKLETSVTVLIA